MIKSWLLNCIPNSNYHPTVYRLFREKSCYVIMEKREETHKEKIERQQRMQEVEIDSATDFEL